MRFHVSKGNIQPIHIVCRTKDQGSLCLWSSGPVEYIFRFAKSRITRQVHAGWKLAIYSIILFLEMCPWYGNSTGHLSLFETSLVHIFQGNGTTTASYSCRIKMCVVTHNALRLKWRHLRGCTIALALWSDGIWEGAQTRLRCEVTAPFTDTFESKGKEILHYPAPRVRAFNLRLWLHSSSQRHIFVLYKKASLFCCILRLITSAVL